mgnify:CR=1 FL=1
MSHPVWVRGLKLSSSSLLLLQLRVAPRVGAWIETRLISLTDKYPLSHPVWVRGLKLSFFAMGKRTSKSHPVWVRGLKLPLWTTL